MFECLERRNAVRKPIQHTKKHNQLTQSIHTLSIYRLNASMTMLARARASSLTVCQSLAWFNRVIHMPGRHMWKEPQTQTNTAHWDKEQPRARRVCVWGGGRIVSNGVWGWSKIACKKTSTQHKHTYISEFHETDTSNHLHRKCALPRRVWIRCGDVLRDLLWHDALEKAPRPGTAGETGHTTQTHGTHTLFANRNGSNAERCSCCCVYA